MSDTAPIEAVSRAWKEAFNAGDIGRVVELYALDAVLSAPGHPVVVGNTAIGEYFFRTADQNIVVRDEPMGEVVTSGDLAWWWMIYEVSDKAGNPIDAGQLVTMFRRVDGEWKIAGDTWNSNGAVTPGM